MPTDGGAFDPLPRRLPAARVKALGLSPGHLAKAGWRRTAACSGLQSRNAELDRLARRRRVVSMRLTRVVFRRFSTLRAKRPPGARRRAETGSPASSVDRIRGRCTRSSTRPASRGATNRTVRWWSTARAFARRDRSSAIPGIRAPGWAMHAAIALEPSSPRWLACRKAVRRTSRAARRVVRGRLRQVVACDGAAELAPERSRLGRRSHRCNGAAPELDPRVLPTLLLPPRHRSGPASPSSAALVPAPPSVALRGPRAHAVVASDDGVNVSEKDGEENREGERVSERAPPLRPARCHAVDDRLAAWRQRSGSSMRTAKGAESGSTPRSSPPDPDAGGEAPGLRLLAPFHYPPRK